MNGPRATGGYIFDRPALYQIRLRGRLPLTWSDPVTAMAIEVTTAAGEEPVTVLQGEVMDQAALRGLLNQIYSLQMTILSVVRVEDVDGS